MIDHRDAIGCKVEPFYAPHEADRSFRPCLFYFSAFQFCWQHLAPLRSVWWLREENNVVRKLGWPNQLSLCEQSRHDSGNFIRLALKTESQSTFDYDEAKRP